MTTLSSPTNLPFARYSLHGLPIDCVTMEQALSKIDDFIREGGPHQIITLDASMCVICRDDDQLREIVQKADLVTPDSAGVLWASGRAGNPLPARVSGVEIVERMCASSVEKGHRLFFFGAAPGVADQASSRMAEKYPGCNVVGTRDGFFSETDNRTIVEQIKTAKPDALFVAMGIPRQEKWIDRFREELGVPVLIGVGGTFDVMSGNVKRAPLWMQRLNLEWLYRLIKNPKKIGKVMMLPKFVLMTLRSR